MRRRCTAEQFSRLQGDEAANAAIVVTSTGEAVPGDSGRIIRYTFSTPAVARDMHTVAADAWQTEAFMRNPVFLWAHDDSSLPIGRVVSITTSADKLVGAVEYASAELNPFADTVYRMVRAGYLNAVSTSWIPIEGRMSKDRERPGGVDFYSVDLLEISQVPVPAHPDALASARAAGIDTGPIYRWAEKLLDTGGLTLIGSDELNELRRAAKAPEKTVKTREVVTRQAAHLKAAGKPAFKRGLYDCAYLAQTLASLGYCVDTAKWESEVEGDNSQVPAMLGEALQKLGAALIAMTQEEVSELLAQHDMGTEEGATARAWTAAHKRAGKSISAQNAAQLERAAGHHARAMKHHADMGEHHEAMATHMESMRAACTKAEEQSGKADEALQRAVDDPENSQSHIKSAQRCMRAIGKAHRSAAETGEDMSGSHADMGDSHAGMDRSMQRITQCMRALSGEGSDEEDDAEEATDAEPKDADKKDDAEAEKQAVERRKRLALAHKLRVA